VSPAFQYARRQYMEAKERREALEASIEKHAETAHPGITAALDLAKKDEQFLREQAVKVFVEKA
jgi:hypothetical protein